MRGKMQRNEKSEVGSSKITVTVIDQKGDEVSCKIRKNVQLGKLMSRYCERKSGNVDSVAFLFGDCVLRREQTPDELRMQDRDKIYAFHAKSLRQNKRNGPSLGVKEGSHAQSQVKLEEQHADNNSRGKEMHDNAFTSDELQKSSNHAFEQAKSFARIMIEEKLAEKDFTIEKMQNEIQQSNAAISNLSKEQTLVAEGLAAKIKKVLMKPEKEMVNVVRDLRIMIEKKLAKKDLMIEKIQNELQQANAAISNLSKEQSLLVVELSNVKKELVKPKEERVNVVRDEGGNKRRASLRRPWTDLKRRRLRGPVSTKKSSLVESSKSIPEEEKKSADDSVPTISIRFILDEESTLFSLQRNTMFGKLMEAYCDRESHVFYNMRFMYNGHVIREEQTPNELELKDCEEIIVELTATPGEVIFARQDPVPVDRTWLLRVLYDLLYRDDA